MADERANDGASDDKRASTPEPAPENTELGIDQETIAALAADPTKMGDAELQRYGLLDAVNAKRAELAAAKAADGEQTDGETAGDPAAEEEPEAGDDADEEDAAEAGDASDAEGKSTAPPGLVQERRRRQRAEDALKASNARMDRLEALLERALTGGAKPAQETQQAPPDPIAEVDARIADLDSRFDEGDIDEAEHRRETRKLLDERSDLKIAAALAQVSGNGRQASSMIEAVSAANEVKELAAKADPWLTRMDPADHEDLVLLAMRKANREGFKDLTTPAGDLAFRRAIVSIGEARGYASAVGQTTSTTTQPPTTPTAQARDLAARKAALKGLSGTIAPDIASVPGSAQGTADLADEQLLKMTEDQLAALPDAQRAALHKRVGLGF